MGEEERLGSSSNGNDVRDNLHRVHDDVLHLRVGRLMPWSGVERRKSQVEPIHPWRWRLLTAWIIIFSIVTVLAYKQSASVDDLQKANCNLKRFLVTAANARIRDANTIKSKQQVKIDLRASNGYLQIANSYERKSVGSCKLQPVEEVK